MDSLSVVSHPTEVLSRAILPKSKDLPFMMLDLKLVANSTEECKFNAASLCYNSPTNSEPPSPDSGFSSDENVSPLLHRDARSNTLPSALRRSRSKASSKRVRFADAFGLDLEKRQYFTDKEANQYPTSPSSPTPGHRLVLSNFTYLSESEYNQRAREHMVCLAKLRAHDRTINGQVNVVNIVFAKKVAIRYTINNWQTFNEVEATYGHNVFGANNVDAFVFSMVLPPTMKEGKCMFCVRYTANGNEYWDNNSGANFCVDMVPETIPCSASEYTQQQFAVSRLKTSSNGSFFFPRRLRRWGRAQEESDDESSRMYIPRRRVL